MSFIYCIALFIVTYPFADLDYVYAQCSGIFVASTVYFAIYCAAMNNKPRVYSRAILPGNTASVFTLVAQAWSD